MAEKSTQRNLAEEISVKGFKAATRNILLLILAAPVDKNSSGSTASNHEGLDLGTTSFFFYNDTSYFEHYFPLWKTQLFAICMLMG